MDVHKESVVTSLYLIDEYGEFTVERRRWGTMTRHLREMAEWLQSHRVEKIAMEATGVYWKPVWNILEAQHRFDLLLAKKVSEFRCRRRWREPVRYSEVPVRCSWSALIVSLPNFGT
jgi:hypothetical protein